MLHTALNDARWRNSLRTLAAAFKSLAQR